MERMVRLAGVFMKNWLMKRQGLEPEIIPSTFPEDLPHADFAGRLSEYPIATAKEKVSRSGPVPMRSCFQSRRPVADI